MSSKSTTSKEEEEILEVTALLNDETRSTLSDTPTKRIIF